VMMRIQSMQTDEISSIGNFKLNHATLEIGTERSSFRLSIKEFQMMKIFMDNPGIPIPADILLDKVWGTGSDEKRETVWAYISFLRNKLKALYADVEIHTVDKESYRLEVHHDR